MSYNNVSSCGCCEGNDCPCNVSGATDGVPCWFKVVGTPFSSFCGYTVDRFCPFNDASDLVNTLPLTRNSDGGVLTHWSPDILMPFWKVPTSGECSDTLFGRKHLILQNLRFTLTRYSGTDGTSDWRIRLVDVSGSDLATWVEENWDAHVGDVNGVFDLDVEDSDTSLYFCGDNIAPDTTGDSLSDILPAQILLSAQCFSAGCSPGDPKTACFDELDEAADNFCDANSVDTYVESCTGNCTWEWSGAEWSLDTNDCLDMDCGCGPEPYCADGLSASDTYTNDNCFKQVTPPASAANRAWMQKRSVPVPEMAWNFLGAIVRTIRAMFSKETAVLVPLHIADRRMSICKSCDHFHNNACVSIELADGTIEKGCGCNLPAKTRLSAEKCPLDKW